MPDLRGRDYAMLKLNKTAIGYEVRGVGGSHFRLPSAADLKAAAMKFSEDDSDAVRILDDCDFDFEIVPGKDMIEELIGVVITTSPEGRIERDILLCAQSTNPHCVY